MRRIPLNLALPSRTRMDDFIARMLDTWHFYLL